MTIYKEAGRDERGMFPPIRERTSEIQDSLSTSLARAADDRTREGKLTFSEALKIMVLRLEIKKLIDKIRPRS